MLWPNLMAPSNASAGREFSIQPASALKPSQAEPSQTEPNRTEPNRTHKRRRLEAAEVRAVSLTR